METALAKMKAEWEPVVFDLSETFRSTGTTILKGLAEPMALLDEHIVHTQAMMFSMFKGPHEQDIESWNARLMLMSETLDEWVKVAALVMPRPSSIGGCGGGRRASEFAEV